MRVIFMGTPDFAIPCLAALSEKHDVVAVVTQPDKAQGRGRRVSYSPVKKFALEHDLAVLQPENVNDVAFVDSLIALDPDVIIVVAYGQILRQRLLKLGRYGVLNVHASLLPQLRGGAPIHRSIMNGDSETGVTIMRVERKLDSGAIYLQKRIPIGEGDTVEKIHDALATLGADLLIQTLAEFPHLEPIPQDHASATFAPIIKKEDRVIDWSNAAGEVYNQIRGLNPWPIALSSFRGQLIQLSESKVLDRAEKATVETGEIVKITDEGPVIQCGQGRLLLLSLKPAGKKWMSGADFCRGYRCSVGEKFQLLGGEKHV